MEEMKNEERKTYKTLLKGSDKRSKMDYNVGKIEGLMWAICGSMNAKPKHNTRIKDGILLEVDTKYSRYDLFTRTIEKYWPGLCVFDCGRE